MADVDALLIWPLFKRQMGLSVLNALAKAGESNAAVMELCIGHILKPLREATGRMSMSLEEISRLFFKVSVIR
jgi:hypothetical protein